ncbi:MAG: NAD(P)-binding protein [Anaerolineales bacterium]|nr:NAD(P)-binding protein [Anaerolineales bacterium]
MTVSPSSDQPAKEKIAILGGGVGALVTAFGLTESGKDYDITVYQMGWRLGGKGASGRNLDPAYHYRIEEHGLHVWAGLYDNAFGVIRKCYAELGRAPDAPLGTWQEAFKPQNFVVVEEKYKDQWYHWPFNLPTNDQLPGEPDARLFPSIWSYIEEAIELMRHFLAQHLAAKASAAPPPPQMEGWLKRLIDRLTAGLEQATLTAGDIMLYAAQQLARRLAEADDPDNDFDLGDILRWLGHGVEESVEGIFLRILTHFVEWIWADAKDSLDHLAVRQAWIFINFGYGNIHGIIEDDLITDGFYKVDDQDYRAWLGKYVLADDGLTLNSPLAFFVYDADFAYEDGDFSKPLISAGVTLYTLIRMAFTWKGALIWKMQAGMGDTVFTPLYRVLQKRGVKFKFFHRVKGLHLADDKQSIEAITIGVQAKLKNPDLGYQPLIDIKGLECWPSTPFYDQLVDGDTLKQVNFEDWCTADIEELQLKAGVDFDQVVLGISIGMFPYICCDLIEHNAAWKTMVDQVRTVRTQALQLWLKPTAYSLGWTLMQEPLLSTYDVNPIDSWADMSHLLEREGWPAVGDHFPLNIAYFCGPMADDPPITPGVCGPQQTCAELSQDAGVEMVRQEALDMLNNDVGHIFPNAVGPDGKGFKWELLVDDRPGQHQGVERLEAQYIRANVQPTERYVLSLPGSTRYRLDPGDSQFDNLYLAGDWTLNAFNAGNVEAATISGLLASNSISGYPQRSKIVGWNFGRGVTK